MHQLAIADSEIELRLSPKAVLAMLLMLAAALSLSPKLLPVARQVPFALFVYGLSALAWILDTWRPRIGRWCTVMTLLLTILFMQAWLTAPGSLALMALPIITAAALISLTAAAMLGIAQTGILILMATYGIIGIHSGDILVPLVGIWFSLGIMVVIYHPVYQVVEWSWGYFQNAQQSLERARDSQVRLKQALADLADANLHLARLNRLAQGLRHAAEDARRAKEQFVANVSHELRTPLNMIIGFSQMVVEAPETYPRPIPRALLADLEVILRNARHLSSLVDDVLDLAQIEAEKMPLIKERVALPVVIEDALIAVRPLFESKGLYLKTEIAEQLPLVFCDPTRIREVILNLLSNAGRFTERGGVLLRAWQEGGDVLVGVTDTGPGISPKDKDKIFRSFEQLDASIARRHSGTGLGLAISKNFVELHGGKMWLESIQGRGTTFFFRLPIDSPSPVEGEASRWLAPHWEYHQRTRPTLAGPAPMKPRLVVWDGSQVLQRLLTRYLDGAEIVPVDTLEQAVEELGRSPSQALLVNDLSMADSLVRVMEMAELPYSTPAIVCSIPGARKAADALGATHYLVKPISRDELVGALDELGVRGKTILVVDNEPEALRLFWRILVSTDPPYRVLSSTDARQALDTLKHQRPDAILLDLLMPEMDGFQFLAAKEADPDLADIPVVVVSARDPVGNPIVSNAAAIVHKGGLTLPQLLRCIEVITGPLTPPALSGRSTTIGGLHG